MKALTILKWVFVCVTATATSGAVGERTLSYSTSTFESSKERVSYAIGVRYGQGLKRQVGELDLEMFLQGLKGGHEGEKLLLEDKQIVQLITRFKQKRISKMNAENDAKAKENRVAGNHYLENNQSKDGVVTMVSGLQYKVLKKGTGSVPTLTDTVRVHYHGTLIDGVVFDSSVNRGESITFRVDGVIEGWTEALQLMKPGAKWQLYIPSELAYGETGTSGSIGPNSALIFEVELIAIES
ncbi:MAG: FKBP-type peptidyl-prolyl cis-trans isomerase [Pseudomonadales bacterium]|nr:FKBP-type peptidyl-prolyl cis-trans isomerase [Pseudomonadales bacterium]